VVVILMWMMLTLLSMYLLMALMVCAVDSVCLLIISLFEVERLTKIGGLKRMAMLLMAKIKTMVR
jgi:hypothetical protein